MRLYLRVMVIKMNELKKVILEKIGNREIKASDVVSDLYIEGYEKSDIGYAILSLWHEGEIDLVGNDKNAGSCFGFISTAVYKRHGKNE